MDACIRLLWNILFIETPKVYKQIYDDSPYKSGKCAGCQRTRNVTPYRGYPIHHLSLKSSHQSFLSSTMYSIMCLYVIYYVLLLYHCGHTFVQYYIDLVILKIMWCCSTNNNQNNSPISICLKVCASQLLFKKKNWFCLELGYSHTCM